MKTVFATTREKMEKSVSSLKYEYNSIRAGRANAAVLDKIQVEMLERARAHREEHTYTATNFEEFEKTINEKPGFIKAMWCGNVECENKIKEYDGLETLIENIAIDKYIFSFFKDYMEVRDLGKTYFNYEVEYIISGKLDELEIKKDIEDKIVILRNILNLYYLYTCPEKRDSAMALATAVTPGAMSFITQGIILEAWAYAEAKNDLKEDRPNTSHKSLIKCGSSK